MLHECKNCHKKAETLKMCAACSMVWYCDSECQKKDWLIHLIDCNPGRPITSADHLVASIYGCFAPKDEMALHDYGLTRSGTLAELQMRAQVYRILIVELQVKAKTIHRWMEEGILDTMMRETFDAKLPPHRRQQDTYYLWFRNNQSTFGRSPVSLWQSEIGMAVADATRAAWTFMGRDPSDSDGTIITAVRELSGDHKACFYLVNSLVSGLCPYKGIKIGLQHPWISFGFCASPDPRGKDVLRSGYMRLLQRVSYDALYQAYVSSSLASLFAENELAIDNPFILDVLSSRNYKSVWYLKEFACTDDDLARNIHADPSICADYGFNNCLNVDEVITLRNAYKQVFMRTDADPLALHEACLRGELFEYVGQSARLKPTQVFKQLMKNSYPLRNDWPVHLVYCNPGRPITTADRLVAAVHVEIPPEDDMTLHDYGFTQFRTTGESETRLQVYRLLIVELQVKAKTIHRWMEEGILGTMMRDTFDARLSPDKRQQKAYLWFRNNQSTFGRNPVSLMDSERAKVMQDGKLAAWMFMGGSPSDSDETIRAAMQELSEDHRACFLFIALLAIHVRPCTGISMGSKHAWVDFGFCGCTNPREEGDLGAKYGRLLGRVDYNTFYQAYISSSLPKLFAENGLAIDNPFVLDVLGSRKYKSVWYLKDFVCTDDEIARNTIAVPAIGGDYGFNNCQSISEVVALRNAYKQVFMRTDANPLALHEACIRGKLYEYVGQVARLKPARLFKRLMKNPYPPTTTHVNSPISQQDHLQNSNPTPNIGHLAPDGGYEFRPAPPSFSSRPIAKHLELFRSCYFAMIRECKHCHEQAENLKKCSACSAVWYCNSECQKNNWLIHLVDCNPGRPITTADRLVASIYGYIPPDDDMTLQDYGFMRTPAAEGMEMRLQVYRILIVELQVKAKTIHRWMEEGILDTMMRETFDAKLPPHRRQHDAYYLWFRNNQSTFGRGSGSFEDSEMMKWMIEARQTAWGFFGRNPSDSHETIQAALAEFSADQQACFQFVSFMHARMHPGPGISLGPGAQHLWIYFGYCGCDDQRGEDYLSGRYIMLLQRVSYNTFYQAYISSSLPKLLEDNGLAINNPFILDVLSSRNYKSVWFLKEFVSADDELARKNHSTPAVGADYGFFNCQNVDEVITLRNAYKQVFMRSDADPLALHEACIRGKLFEHVGQLTRLKPAQLFKRLMENPYPLQRGN